MSATVAADAVAALQRLLPASVAVDCRSDEGGAGSVLGSEEAALAAGSSARDAEFRAARDCASRALAQLGGPQRDIPTGLGGQPLWPPGFVGSLSHCPGLRTAAVAHLRAVRSIGIDAELNRPLRPAVVATIVRGGEAGMIQRLASQHPAVAWSAVLWSAKESIFKAWYPLTEQWRDYTQCEVTIQPGRGSFRGRMLESVGGNVAGDFPLTFSGRWTVVGRHVLTAVAVPPPVV